MDEGRSAGCVTSKRFQTASRTPVDSVMRLGPQSDVPQSSGDICGTTDRHIVNGQQIVAVRSNSGILLRGSQVEICQARTP